MARVPREPVLSSLLLGCMVSLAGAAVAAPHRRKPARSAQNPSIPYSLIPIPY